MLKALIAKELREILNSTKFLVVVICVAVLCLATFLNGISSFIETRENLFTGSRDSLKTLHSEKSYNDAGQKGYRVYLRLPPTSIYDFGLFRSYGLDSTVNDSTIPQLSSSPGVGFQGLNTLGFLDPVTIINSVFSLFAILFSYNLISGERQEGMLRIIFANSVSRNKVLLAKLIGGILPLWLIVIIPVLLGAIAIQIFTGVNYSLADLLDLLQLLGISMLYVSTFFLIGLLISCLTKNPFNSFLFSIVVWVILVVVVPRIAVNMAEIVSPVDSADKLKNEEVAYKADVMGRMGKYFQDYANENKIKYSGWMGQMQKMISYAGERYKEESLEFHTKQIRKANKQRNAFLTQVSLFSIVSPSASYASAARRITRTHFEYIEKIEEILEQYRVSYSIYFKGKEDPNFFDPQKMMDRFGVSFKKGPGGYLIVESIPNNDVGQLDLSGMPAFSGELRQLEPDITMLLMEYGTLLFMCLLLVLCSVLAFQRYDVR